VICITAASLVQLEDEVCTSDAVRWRSALALLLFTTLLPLRASAPHFQSAVCPQLAFAVSPSALQNKICSLVLDGNLPDLHWPEFTRYRDQARKFYAETQYSPAWIEADQPSAQAHTLIDLFQQAELKGLQPEDYDASRWPARLQRFNDYSVTLPVVELSVFDVAMTISALRYVSDLNHGRVDPNQASYSLPPRAFDAAAFLRAKIVRSSDVRTAVQEAEPAFLGYRRTLKALETYLELAQKGEETSLPAVSRPVVPGSSYPGTALLAQKLRRVGDLNADAQLPMPADLYSGVLVAAVQHFQQRHGITPDGRLGPDTIRQLNVPITQRVMQLKITLERWRWLPSGLKAPVIVVNIPEFRLRAYEDHRSISMNVIVGKAYTPTPVFVDEMEYLVFRPYWNVPLSIVRKELAPALRKNPGYLDRHEMEIIDRAGHVLSVNASDPAVLNQLRAGRLEIRQRPGPANSLGLIKFVFPNDYDVYLHGTPERQLFARAVRAFSHGCIRVEDPAALALWVLGNNPDWNPERIASAMYGDSTLQVNLPQHIPVLILYGTALVEESGDLHFFEDIYGLDRVVERALVTPHP
jgi:murein L,D-transpeptidase YcbB/YkuD